MREIEKDKKARMRIKKAEKDIKSKIKHLLRSGVHTRDVTDFAKGYSFFFFCLFCFVFFSRKRKEIWKCSCNLLNC